MDIIRAWQDIDDRNSLSAAAWAARPENPAGELALTEEDLGAVVGGMRGSTNNPLLEQRLQQLPQKPPTHDIKRHHSRWRVITVNTAPALVEMRASWQGA